MTARRAASPSSGGGGGMQQAAHLDAAQQAAVLRRTNAHLLPPLFLVSFACQLDRSNLAFAALQMRDDLHITSSVYGLGAGAWLRGGATRLPRRPWLSVCPPSIPAASPHTSPRPPHSPCHPPTTRLCRHVFPWLPRGTNPLLRRLRGGRAPPLAARHPGLLGRGRSVLCRRARPCRLRAAPTCARRRRSGRVSALAWARACGAQPLRPGSGRPVWRRTLGLTARCPSPCPCHPWPAATLRSCCSCPSSTHTWI